MTTLNAGGLLKLAKEVQACIDSGTMSLKTPVNISLEVCNDADEDTFGNRVFGGSEIEVGVITRFDKSQYPHIQLIGEPNFTIYSETKP